MFFFGCIAANLFLFLLQTHYEPEWHVSKRLASRERLSFLWNWKMALVRISTRRSDIYCKLKQFHRSGNQNVPWANWFVRLIRRNFKNRNVIRLRLIGFSRRKKWIFNIYCVVFARTTGLLRSLASILIGFAWCATILGAMNKKGDIIFCLRENGRKKAQLINEYSRVGLMNTKPSSFAVNYLWAIQLNIHQMKFRSTITQLFFFGATFLPLRAKRRSEQKLRAFIKIDSS